MKEERKLVRVSLRLYADDVEFLRERFPRVGYNKVVREKVHRVVVGMRERESQELAKLGDTNVVPFEGSLE